ncbi:Tfp pilus assembly protein FimT/FimU [Pelosinus sp. sgz500959]|uniref:pilus assembly FimT family protein n=1 Tax=Pelosinus sp. sgz500959 TaxID=3242472 RepID=UPI00366B1989
MRQRGATFLELMICIGVLGILANVAILAFSSSLANQQLVSSSLQLVADIRWLQQQTINEGRGAISYVLLFNHAQPYGYYITANGQSIKTVNFPTTVKLSGSHSPIGFAQSGAPVIGAQSIGLQSTQLKTWKYVILAPVTGRVRISDSNPSPSEW